MNRHYDFDTSEELLLQRWKYGVQLVRPDEISNEATTSHSAPITSTSIRDLFTMPFNAYFLNKQSVMLNVCEKTAHICGYDHRKDIIGTTVLDCFKKDSAEMIIRHDHAVLEQERIIFEAQYPIRSDGTSLYGIEIKFPLLDVSQKIIGIFGCTILQDSFTAAFDLLMSAGLFVPTFFIENQNNDYSICLSAEITPQEVHSFTKTLSRKYREFFSQREGECLLYLMRGKSARETGIALNISQRTVEFYLYSLKDKLHCRKKSEIVDKVVAALKH